MSLIELHLSRADSHRLERLLHTQEQIASILYALLCHLRQPPNDPAAQAAIDALTARLKASNDKLSAALTPDKEQ